MDMLHFKLKRTQNNKFYQETKLNNNLIQELPHTLTNVYQEQFSNGYSSGIGDFIRGSIFLLQLCKLYNINCEITFKNHQISKFLNISNNNPINDLTITRDIGKINIISFNVNDKIQYTVASVNESIKLFKKYIFENRLHRFINTIFYPLYSDILVEHKE